MLWYTIQEFVYLLYFVRNIDTFTVEGAHDWPILLNLYTPVSFIICYTLFLACKLQLLENPFKYATFKSH